MLVSLFTGWRDWCLTSLYLNFLRVKQALYFKVLILPRVPEKWHVNWLIHWVIDKILTNSKNTADPTKFHKTKWIAYEVFFMWHIFLYWHPWTSRELCMPWDGMKNYMCVFTCVYLRERWNQQCWEPLFSDDIKPEVRGWKREGEHIIQGAEGAGEGETGLLVKATVGWVLI